MFEKRLREKIQGDEAESRLSAVAALFGAVSHLDKTVVTLSVELSVKLV